MAVIMAMAAMVTAIMAMAIMDTVIMAMVVSTIMAINQVRDIRVPPMHMANNVQSMATAIIEIMEPLIATLAPKVEYERNHSKIQL